MKSNKVFIEYSSGVIDFCVLFNTALISKSYHALVNGIFAFLFVVSVIDARNTKLSTLEKANEASPTPYVLVSVPEFLVMLLYCGQFSFLLHTSSFCAVNSFTVYVHPPYVYISPLTGLLVGVEQSNTHSSSPFTLV